MKYFGSEITHPQHHLRPEASLNGLKFEKFETKKPALIWPHIKLNAACEMLWCTVVLFGTVWYCVVLCGTVWYCVVLGGNVRKEKKDLTAHLFQSFVKDWMDT